MFVSYNGNPNPKWSLIGEIFIVTDFYLWQVNSFCFICNMQWHITGFKMYYLNGIICIVVYCHCSGIKGSMYKVMKSLSVEVA